MSGGSSPSRGRCQFAGAHHPRKRFRGNATRDAVARCLELRRQQVFGRHPAEALVVDQAGLRGRVAAHGTLRVPPHPYLTPRRGERIEEQQAARHRLAGTEDQLDRLEGLEAANDAGKHAEHPGFGAAGHQPGRRRFGEETAVAGATWRPEEGKLAVEAEDAPVDVGLLEQHARVVDQIAGGKVVAAVEHHVPITEDLHRISGGDLGVVRSDLDVRVEVGDPLAGGVELGSADGGGTVQNLALEVGEVHCVKIHQPRWPTPAAARYMAAGEPRPPAPTTSTRAPRSRSCPSRPTSPSTRWRA
jgi:hypothetical protein